MSSVNNENKSIGKSGAIIIVICVALVITTMIAGIAIASSINWDSSEESTGYHYSYSETGELIQTTQDAFENYFTDDTVTESISQETYLYPVSQESVVTNREDSTKNEAIEYYESLSKNGDNMLSDNYNNQFIKLVSERYTVDADLLVAIYSVPDTGNNFVLEFDGTKDSKGNILKSPDTLKKVYHIDLNKNIKVATANGVDSVGVSYAEGIFCFNMVKTIVMEQYPDYFTGIK